MLGPKPLKYIAYNYKAFSKSHYARFINTAELNRLGILSDVFPFKVNNYILDHLIEWENYPEDPIYNLVFPVYSMLNKNDFDNLASLKGNTTEINYINEVRKIQSSLNPHPAGQIELNIPSQQEGLQHKYHNTVLFFPQHGQTCHAYCSFCFRWPQFTGNKEWKIASQDVQKLVFYLKNNPQISDLIFTGGDPLIMSSKLLRFYIEPLLKPKLKELNTIRIGTKALSYWPQRFINDSDSEDLLQLFRDIKKAGYHLSIMAHFNHSKELKTPLVQLAIENVLATGAIIRTQAPILKTINASPNAWVELWEKQIGLGLVPYYMFLPRDTGAQTHFAIPIWEAYKIFKEASEKVSGLAKTVRGPVMSMDDGKLRVLGKISIKGKEAFLLDYIQSRDPQKCNQPFLKAFSNTAIWWDELDEFSFAN